MSANAVEVDICYETAINLAKDAGKIIKNAIGSSKSIKTKCSFADLVTETDKQVEDFLISGFKKHFPDHKFIGEESTDAGIKCELTDAPTWIIDPVDGTMNFVHRFPFVAISIALSVNKCIVIGIVYNPILERMYTACKGRGSFCNGVKLQVSGVEDISKSLVLMETGSNRTPEAMNNVIANYVNLAPVSHGIRSVGSAALNMCTVASGEAEAYFEFAIHCWDIAAGKLIIEEAGGVVTDTEGGPLDLMARRVLCASSKSLANTISSKLNHILLERD